MQGGNQDNDAKQGLIEETKEGETEEDENRFNE